MPASTWAILPVKPFNDAKSRLKPVLGPAERREPARSLMRQSLDVLLNCREFVHVLVVSSDQEALTLATQQGALTLTESGFELNAALEEARQFAIAGKAASLLVLASDLPLLAASDIDALIAAGSDADIVIAPDRRGEGTNALLLQPASAIEFSFGVSSFPRHVRLASESGHSWRELNLSGLAFDVDLPEDWNDLQSGGLLLHQALHPGPSLA